MRIKIIPGSLYFLLLTLLLIPACSKITSTKTQPNTERILTSAQNPSQASPSPGVDNKTGLIDGPSSRPEEKSVSGQENREITNDPALLYPFALTVKEEVADWVQDNFTHYFQKYNLSCEAALIRMVAGIWGITDLSEDDILDIIPAHPSNPELGLVMENISGDVYFFDGSINWANYGAHPPVVKQTLEFILKDSGLDSLYRIEQKKLDNKELIKVLKNNPDCLGAVIWVAAYIDKEKPPVNEIGQVLGEHVQFVSPLLSKQGRMLVYDVWPWENQPFHLYVPFNRDMFDYETLLIIRCISTPLNSDSSNE